jgi:hypothetical protein
VWEQVKKEGVGCHILSVQKGLAALFATKLFQPVASVLLCLMDCFLRRKRMKLAGHEFTKSFRHLFLYAVAFQKCKCFCFYWNIVQSFSSMKINDYWAVVRCLSQICIENSGETTLEHPFDDPCLEDTSIIRSPNVSPKFIISIQFDLRNQDTSSQLRT